MRLLLIIVLVASIKAVPQEKNASIAGTVLDVETGLPVSQVELQIVPPLVRAFSDENGHFSFKGLPAGAALIKTKRAGYSPARMKERKIPGNSGIPIELISGKQTEGTIYISKVPVMTGRIIDSQGQAVQNVRVAAYRLTFDNTGTVVPTEFSAVTTNDLGVYRSSDLEPGEYFVRFDTPMLRKTPDPNLVSYTSYYPGTIDQRNATPVVLESGVENRLNDVILSSVEGRLLTIRIVNEISAEGTALLLLKRSDTNLSTTISIKSTAQPTQVGRLAPGTYDLEIYIPRSLATGKATVDILDHDVNTDIRIEKAVLVSGSVNIRRSQARAGVGGVQVHLLDPFGVRVKDVFFVSGTDGKLTGGNSAIGVFSGNYELRVTNVPAATYVEEIIAPNIHGNHITFDARDSQQVLEVRLNENPAIIEGDVLDKDGRPVPNAVVALIPDDQERPYRLVSSVADNRAHYVIHAGPGMYRLYSWLELNGTAYENREFMEHYRDRGVQVSAGGGEHLPKVDLQTLED